MPLQSNFAFTIEEHDPQGRWPFVVHAGANNISVARAAYFEMLKHLPERRVLLRNGARVILSSDRKQDTPPT
jgi:hypothetical protein